MMDRVLPSSSTIFACSASATYALPAESTVIPATPDPVTDELRFTTLSRTALSPTMSK